MREDLSAEAAGGRPRATQTGAQVSRPLTPRTLASGAGRIRRLAASEQLRGFPHRRSASERSPPRRGGRPREPPPSPTCALARASLGHAGPPGTALRRPPASARRGTGRRPGAECAGGMTRAAPRRERPPPGVLGPQPVRATALAFECLTATRSGCRLLEVNGRERDAQVREKAACRRLAPVTLRAPLHVPRARRSSQIARVRAIFQIPYRTLDRIGDRLSRTREGRLDHGDLACWGGPRIQSVRAGFVPPFARNHPLRAAVESVRRPLLPHDPAASATSSPVP